MVFLKVVDWGGDGKRLGENGEVEYVTENVTPLRSAPQFISLTTSQVDPTETTTYGLPLSLDRFFSSLDHLPRLQELRGMVGRRKVVVFVCLCSSETGESEDTFYG